MPNGGGLTLDGGQECMDCGRRLLSLARCTRCGEDLVAGVIPRTNMHPVGQLRYAHGRASSALDNVNLKFHSISTQGTLFFDVQSGELEFELSI